MNKTILIFQPDIPPYRWGVFEQVIARIRGDVLFFRMRNKENKALPESIKERLLTNAHKTPTTPVGFFLEILRLYFKIRPDVVILSPTPHFLAQMTILLLQKMRFRLWNQTHGHGKYAAAGETTVALASGVKGRGAVLQERLHLAGKE